MTSFRSFPFSMLFTLLVSGCGASTSPPDETDGGATDAAIDLNSKDQGVEPDGALDTGSDVELSDQSVADADTGVPPPNCGEDLLVTREGTNGNVSFRLDRCMPHICGGGCPVTSPQLTVVNEGHTDVAMSNDIVYTKTHHNWADSLIATLPDRRLTWRVEFDFTGPMVEWHHIAIEGLDGTPILDETVFNTMETY